MTESEDYEILKIKDTKIQDVWANNYEEELYKIMELTQKYNVIAMDTEFPGVNYFPPQGTEDKDYEYALIQQNVNHQKIIQIGISICDEQGNVPSDVFTWQFNFQFDENKDEISEDSKTLLKNAGIDFNDFLQNGLAGQEFSEFFIGSGIGMNDNLIWVAFHGGFDFGYFLRMLYGANIPDKTQEFNDILKFYFPQIYDIKYLVKDTLFQDYGLQRLAIDSLKIQRLGPQHQAGSDSLLTLRTFFKIKQMVSSNQLPINFQERINVIYGIGKGYNKDKTDHYIRRYRNNNQNLAEKFTNNPTLPQNYFMEQQYDMSGLYGYGFMHNFNQLSWTQQYHPQYGYVVDDNNMHHKQDSYGRKKNQNY